MVLLLLLLYFGIYSFNAIYIYIYFSYINRGKKIKKKGERKCPINLSSTAKIVRPHVMTRIRTRNLTIM
jgi:hypothetical protein